MKKVLKIFVATLIAVLTACSFVACTTPETDIALAKSRLENKGYYVMYETESEIDEVGQVETLYATKDVGDDTEYIRMIRFDTYKMAKLYYKQLEKAIEWAIEEYELELDIAEFTLDEYEDKLTQEEKEGLREEIAELKANIEQAEDQKDLMGRSGKVIWYGTETAIEDTND